MDMSEQFRGQRDSPVEPGALADLNSPEAHVRRMGYSASSVLKAPGLFAGMLKDPSHMPKFLSYWNGVAQGVADHIYDSADHLSNNHPYMTPDEISEFARVNGHQVRENMHFHVWQDMKRLNGDPKGGTYSGVGVSGL